jgi:hypothetical protein
MSSHEKCQLVYLVYGKQKSYRQEAKFSMLSALRYTPPESMPDILVYTDEPDAFTDWPVDVVELSSDKLDEWAGRQGYLHRRKAAAIRSALECCERSVFIDTDTFFVTSANRLFERLSCGEWLVDRIEGAWGEWADQPLYAATASLLREKYSVGDDMCLINSGVLGLNHDAVRLMNRAIELIDELHPMAPEIHIIEQFAVGVAAYGLPRPAETRDLVRHYYGEKRYWRRVLDVFFAHYGERYSPALIDALHDVPLSRPKPAKWRRLLFRLASARYAREQRKMARMAFYAVNLPSDVYSAACAPVYALELLKNGFDPSAVGLRARWLGLLSSRQKSRLQALLEEAQKL